MIHAVLIFNTSGIPRLTKFYTPLHQSSQTVIQKIFSLISIRPVGLCNFLDAPELEAFLGPKDDSDERWRVVYRNYATLYFVFVVDGAESELGVLDLIQVFVEALDRAFENVCELDLVFHFDEVHHILAEIIQGGLVLETNVEEISNSGASMVGYLSLWLLWGAGNFGQNFYQMETYRYAMLTGHLAKTASKARKESFASANPLALGAGVGGARNGALPTPLGWLTDKLTGASGR